MAKKRAGKSKAVTLDDGKRPATVEEFKRALLAVSPLADNHLKILRAHYEAVDRTQTATQIADKLGYKNWSGANLQYGRLATSICLVLNRHPSVSLTLLASDYRSAPKGEIQLVMRPELAQALFDLGWLSRSKIGVRTRLKNRESAN